MNRIQKIVVGATMTGSALAGGAIGAALLNGSANAQTSTSTTAPAANAAPTDQRGAVSHVAVPWTRQRARFGSTR